MGLVVFTGGARSGKSAAAQELARQRALDGTPVIVAVFGEKSDPEMRARIARHQNDRPAGFSVLEPAGVGDWQAGIPDDALLVVDCLGTLLSQEMTREMRDADAQGDDTVPDGYREQVEVTFDATVDALLARRGDTIVVTNEVGDGVVPAYASGRVFRDILGRANRRLVAGADSAYLCVAGRLIDLKGLPTSAKWPED